jgi:RND family efflux transporter MFP subunit
VPPAAAVVKAQGTVALAQADVKLARAQEAKSEMLPTPSALLPLDAAVTQARAEARLAEITASQSRVAAPFSGTVVSVPAAIGQDVSPGTTLAVLESSQLTVQAPLAEQVLRLVRHGEPATVAVPGSPSSLAGWVAGVSVSGTAGSLSFPVTIRLASTPAWLLAGQSAAVQITTRVISPAVLVPSQAIVSISGTPQVFEVTAAHRARLVNVTPGVTDGVTTAVSGVAAGAKVVVLGQTYLADDARVRSTGTVGVPSTVAGAIVEGLASATSAAPPLTAKSGGKAGKGLGLGGGTKG